MKQCTICGVEFDKKTKYCGSGCQRVAFSQSQKGKRWSDEKRKDLSEKLKKINGSEEVKQKRKKTNIERYGGVAPICSNIVRDKMKSTCLEKYGVENAMQSEEVKRDAKETMDKRYGGFTLQTSELKIKVAQTCLERYGVENVFQSEAIKEKIKVTCLERYGVENPRQNSDIVEKGKRTCMERYGVENPRQNSVVVEKARATNLKLYGTSGNTNRHLSAIWESINSPEWWEKFKRMSEVRTELDDWLSSSGIERYTHRYRPDLIGTGFSISKPHQKIINLLNEHQIEHEINTRKVIPPLELDIYIPSKNLAIEVNGVYWHSELNGKDKNYHLKKTVECEKKDIQLLQFWDIEVECQWEIVESVLLAKNSIFRTKVGARECVIGTVNRDSEKDFLEKNHLQGYVPSSICYGLYHEGELVSLMSFGRARFGKKTSFELLRFCSRINTRVIGGASKLFKMKPEGSIVSYSDRRYSRGEIYDSLGFSFESINSPAYRYTRDYINFENRIKYQKHKLSSLLESFDPSLTEWENMKANGYDRVWDCRHKVLDK